MEAADFSSLNRLRLPDLWQQEALQALRDGYDVILDAPTGAGKTYVFELFAREKVRHGQMVYTVPTRALANDKFHEWKRAGWQVGIATGDVAIHPDAPLLVATLETQRERMLLDNGPVLLAIDEYQMLADAGRGIHYETAIALTPLSTQLLLLSGSVANPQEIADWLRRIGRQVHVVRTAQRPVPLDDCHVESLPRQASASVTGFFPRLAYAVCLSDLAPLLVFAPQRAAAERIAKEMAAALPEDLPLTLNSAQRALCPPDLCRLLEKRVAYHHSGLPYGARAGVIEPLAKAGQLRVIVATMGLAAGINFSVRSVFVSARSYRDGPFTKLISPDELLQMFGRAGRRGLDTAGTVITTDNTPRLSDARPARIQRSHCLDWPILLRVMDRATRHALCPFSAASQLVQSLFAPSPPQLGWEDNFAASAESPSTFEESASEASPNTYFSHPPQWQELLNGRNEWERAPAAAVSVPLTRCMVRSDDSWLPALRVATVVAGLLPGTRPCKLTPTKDPTRWKYGIELPVATRADDARWLPTRTMVKLANLPSRSAFSTADWEKFLRRRVMKQTQGAAIWDENREGKTLTLRLDPSNILVEAWIDSHGHALLAPPRRLQTGGSNHDIIHPATGQSFSTPAQSPVRAWRLLGLLDADGRPTTRGRVFSLFQRGEGLAIAAALEDTSYPVEEIAWHIADLRAGHRFAESATGESARLAMACRRIYGSWDFPGYLELGLPPGYGDGAADLLARLLLDRKPADNTLISSGDLDRVRVEWLSLLRHIVHAPDIACERWRELQGMAAHILQIHGPKSDPLAALNVCPQHFLELSLHLRHNGRSTRPHGKHG